MELRCCGALPVYLSALLRGRRCSACSPLCGRRRPRAGARCTLRARPQHCVAPLHRGAGDREASSRAPSSRDVVPGTWSPPSDGCRYRYETSNPAVAPFLVELATYFPTLLGQELTRLPLDQYTCPHPPQQRRAPQPYACVGGAAQPDGA
jgi:hypothetical protein